MPTLDKILEADNVCDLLDDERLEKIGKTCVEEYQRDLDSRRDWDKRMEKAIDLALQIREDKNFPWRNASNVKFPLLSIASLQFHSRVYPVMIPGEDLVKIKVIGADPNGQKKSRADRVGRHMSYQCYEQDTDWEEEHDRLLMVLPIMGCQFVKSYYDEINGHPVSEWVMSHDLVIPYFSKSLKNAIRITQRILLNKQEVRERMLMGIYREIDLPEPQLKEPKGERDNRQGMYEQTPENHTMLEQHRYLDLDDDGYDEPYIVTIDETSELVLRIVPRFDKQAIVTDKDKLVRELGRKLMGALPRLDPKLAERAADRMEEIKAGARIVRIVPDQYFTKYSFVPSPDGGIYDLGFGALLGPINESTNTLINQLVDSGTMSNAAGGFLGRGARIKGGTLKFNPFEWNRVDSAGGDLKSNIVPLPVRNPSPVLFSLLQLLINYGERLASVTDMMQGVTPGQNTPATTAMSALEQGMQVFHGIFKRVFRGFKDEYRCRYKLNRRYIDLDDYASLMDMPKEQIASDWLGSENDIRPVADPKMLSSEIRMMRANMLSERAAMVPGYNPVAVEKRWLEAMGFEDTEEIYPTEEGKQIPAPPNPEIELKAAEEQRRTQEAADRAANNEAQIDLQREEQADKRAFMAVQAEEIAARIEQMGDLTALERVKVEIEKLKARKESNERAKDARSD